MRILQAALIAAGLASQSFGIDAWVADPNRRVYPGSFGRDLTKREIVLEGARNEYMILQLAMRNPTAVSRIVTEASDLRGPAGVIPKSAVRVRYPGFIPVDENGQLTPDPLFVRSSIDLRPNFSQPVWIDFTIPENARPGSYTGTISLQQNGRVFASFNVRLEVLNFTLPPVSRDHFYFNILMDPGSVARMHKVERWSDAHWKLLEKYVRDWADHSQDAITVFFIEDPWQMDTGFPVASVVDWKLPGAWEKLTDAQFDFDYSHFDRFVQMCLDAGINKNLQAWSPVNMPHRDYAVIHYRDTASNQMRRLKVAAGTPDYGRVWSQFAQSFERHLREKKWLEMTTVGLDELSTESLDKVVPIFRKMAPNLKLMVSGGDEKGKYSEFSPEMAFHFGFINSDVPMPDTTARRKAGKRTLLYTANTPLRPNTFLFSEPLESRILPWIVWKYDFDGYIRWAWDFWLDQFWQQPRYKWHSGDMFFVYPGEDGPMDSIRGEMLKKGAQDYEILWMLRDKADKEAIEIATQEFDPVRPHRPLPSDIDEARRRLNRLVVGRVP